VISISQLRIKDVVFWTISMAILATFSLSLLFWQSNAEAGSPPTVKKPSQPAIDPKEEQMEIARLKSDIAEKRTKQSEAELALDNKYRELEQRITDYLKQQTGIYGFCLYVQEDVLDDKVDKFIGYNQTEVFKMASTFKLPVNLYLYQQVAENKLSLDTKLLFSQDDFEQGTGSLQYRGPGGKYNIRDLASRSIRESDNVAINMLIESLGRSNISKYMEQIGGHQIPEKGTPTGTPNDLVTYMKATAEFAQAKPELGNLLLEDLKNTIFHDRIRAGTPKEISVGHKIGNLGGTVNDIAIVYAKKTYIIALMSKNIPSDTVATEIEAQVGKLVFDSIGR
jgi:beta-lactamase class A